MYKKVIFVLGIIIALLSPVGAYSDCPTSSERESVLSHFSKNSGENPFTAAEKLNLPALTVLQSLPRTVSYEIYKPNFENIWNSMAAWGDVSVIIRLNGHIIEVHGPIYSGKPSTRSNFFNIHSDGNGFSGHLRPDNLMAVQVLNMTGQKRSLQGINFIGRDGELDFGVYLPSEGSQATDNQVSAFNKTISEVSKKSKYCF